MDRACSTGILEDSARKNESDKVNASEKNKDGQLAPLCYPQRDSELDSSGSLFSRFRQSINNSSLVNLFGQHSSSQNPTISGHENEIESINCLDTNTSDTVCPSFGKPSLVKQIITSAPARSRSETIGSSISDTSVSSNSPSSLSPSPSIFTPVSTCSQPTIATSVSGNDLDYKWSPTFSSLSPMETPSQLSSDMQVDSNQVNSAYIQNSEGHHSSIHIHDIGVIKDVRKGKSPALPSPLDALLPDIIDNRRSTNVLQNLEDVESNGDWWGLAHTLDISRRDRRISDTSSSAAGEHSKSRASWAALHQSSIPSIYADASFQEWQHWHRALEKVELRRRRKRTIDFSEESEHLAQLFVDETYARRAVEIYESNLTPEEFSDALLWVEYAVERRPDPYYPPENHNLGWVLKGHRSFTCLRELKEVPLYDI